MVIILKFENVFYIKENTYILKNINFHVENGDFISIIGSSGSGKSTFLKLCAHLICPTKGNIIFNNKNILDYEPTDYRKKVAYCFQSPYLFEKTVMDNLSFSYIIRHKKVDEHNIKELLNLFNLDYDFVNKKVQDLSGGEKQRIALIRTLLFKPEILLLDEVTSALDVSNTIIVENIIKKLNKEGMTILWVTHNLQQSRKYANKILTFEDGNIINYENIN